MENIELIIQLSKLVGGVVFIYFLWRIELNTRRLKKNVQKEEKEN